jgi:hypothetical protein
MYCGPYLQEFYTLFLTRFKTYKIASPPQTKKTSKDDIKGLVSLKFLHHWVEQRNRATATIVTHVIKSFVLSKIPADLTVWTEM